MVNDIWLELESGRNDILDLSSLMENEDVFMDNLESYLFFEQKEGDLLVYIDEQGRFSEQSYDLTNATSLVTLHDTVIFENEFNDILKQLLHNGQILMGYF